MVLTNPLKKKKIIFVKMLKLKVYLLFLQFLPHVLNFPFFPFSQLHLLYAFFQFLFFPIFSVHHTFFSKHRNCVSNKKNLLKIKIMNQKTFSLSKVWYCLLIFEYLSSIVLSIKEYIKLRNYLN